MTRRFNIEHFFFPTNPIQILFLTRFAFILATFLLWSCASPPNIGNVRVSKPEITLQIASLDLGNLGKRIERKHVVELAKVLKREQVEVLAVQGISRYPGVSTRIDFVNELSDQTDWRNVFGEMQNISGRQTGNSIFSSYPILSHHNQSFDHVKSADFEAALQATIDAGVRSLVVVSTQIPPKATADEQTQCMKLISALNPEETHPLTIIAGNLPSSETVRATNTFTEVPPPESIKGKIPKVWYSANASFQLLTSRAVETDLGTLVIVQLGLYRQK
jgi:hypothetical protein